MCCCMFILVHVTEEPALQHRRRPKMPLEHSSNGNNDTNSSHIVQQGNRR